MREFILALDDAKRLDRFGTPPSPEVLIHAEFRKTSALSNAFVALLACQRPRNLVNGSLIDTGKALSSYNRKEFHHIFPQAYLRDHGVKTTRINSLANICMLSADQNKLITNAQPSRYFAESRLRLGEDWNAVIESNLIPSSAMCFIDSDNYEEFLNARAQHIADAMRTLVCGS